MNAGKILGAIVMILCGFGCGALFFGIGVWATKRKDPMHFYSGTTVDPKTISNVPAYNRENGKMWKQFSVPFWMCGVLAIGSLWADWCAVGYTILIFVGSIAGGVGLVLRYNKIRKKYAAAKAN